MQVHPCSAQALKNKAAQRALERSSRARGFSTQRMLQGLGNPLAFIVVAEQVHDRMPVAGPIAESETGHAMANKAYDADAFIGMTQAKGAAAVLAPRANRTQPPEYEEHIISNTALGAALDPQDQVVSSDFLAI